MISINTFVYSTSLFQIDIECSKYLIYMYAFFKCEKRHINEKKNVIMLRVINMKKIVLATHNAHKVQEFQDALKEFGIEVISASSLGIDEEPIEDGTTFEENALIKARFVASKTNLPVISDDSGLEVHALNNFPGIYSSRFMEGHTYVEKCEEIIRRLKDKEDKTANFTCVIAYIVDQKEYLFKGTCEGVIISELRGHNGFGYDPIFYIPHLNKTYAELTEKEKTSLSHRGNAIQKWKEFLLQHLS